MATISEMYYLTHPDLQQRADGRGGLDDALEYAFLHLVGSAFIEPLLDEDEAKAAELDDPTGGLQWDAGEE
jgi:hypothetical protein